MIFTTLFDVRYVAAVVTLCYVIVTDVTTSLMNPKVSIRPYWAVDPQQSDPSVSDSDDRSVLWKEFKVFTVIFFLFFFWLVILAWIRYFSELVSLAEHVSLCLFSDLEK